VTAKPIILLAVLAVLVVWHACDVVEIPAGDGER
jgi:hypothetical protein